MDEERFDRIAMKVAGGRSRRGVLGGLLSGALGAIGLVRWAPGEEAAAKDGAAGGTLGGRHGKNRRGGTGALFCGTRMPNGKERNDNIPLCD